MHRKSTIAIATLASLASMALPATSSATNDPQLTDAKGTVAVGSLVKATNVGSAIIWNTSTSLKVLECPGATFTGNVEKNSGGTVEIKFTDDFFFGTGATYDGLPECTGEIGNSGVTIRNLPLRLVSTPAMTTHEFQITGAAGANLKVLIGSTVAGECEYEAATSLKGSYTTGTSAATDTKLTTKDTELGSGMKLIRGGFLCISSMTLGMTLTLETDGSSEAIWIS
jgi:hypothetical protein